MSEYQIMSWAGRVNILLAVIAVSLFAFRRMNKYIFANKNALLKQVSKVLSKIHPYIGIALVIIGFVHGKLALGTIFRIHTGPLAWGLVVLMMLVALIGKTYKIKYWLQLHKSLAIVVVIAILVHRLALNIF